MGLGVEAELRGSRIARVRLGARPPGLREKKAKCKHVQGESKLIKVGWARLDWDGASSGMGEGRYPQVGRGDANSSHARFNMRAMTACHAISLFH